MRQNGNAGDLQPGRLLELTRAFCAMAVEAGQATLPIFEAHPAGRLKADNSPVCEADERAEAIILDRLARIAGDIPVVSEEAATRAGTPAVGDTFILVDPLDGTREFLRGSGEFTVNIALIQDGWPMAGVVYAPVKDELWAGYGGGGPHACAWKCRGLPTLAAQGAAAGDQTKLQTRPMPEAGRIVLVSLSHQDARSMAFAMRLGDAELKTAGSSLKFCWIAEAAADAYPRFNTTMEWDTAAGDAVLRAAGGLVCDDDGAPFAYGKAGFRNGPFIAWGDPAAAARF